MVVLKEMPRVAVLFFSVVFAQEGCPKHALHLIQNMLVKVCVAALVILYPAVIYYGLIHDMNWLGLSLFILFFAYKSVSDVGNRWQNGFIVLLLLLGGWLAQHITVKLFPMFIHLSLFALFYQSLRSKTPIIEKFARLDFPDFPEGMAEHCRQMTYIWVCFFAFNIIVIALLTALAPDSWWAWYNGVIAYVLVGILIAGEHTWRKRKFPDLEMPTFRDTVINISKHSHKILRKEHG